MYKRIAEYSLSANLLGAVDTDEGPVANYRYDRLSTVGRSWEFPVAGQGVEIKLLNCDSIGGVAAI